MRLDLHLSPQLMLHACFLQLLFKENLQSQNKLGLTFPGQIHAPKLAFAKSSSDIKVL